MPGQDRQHLIGAFSEILPVIEFQRNYCGCLVTIRSGTLHLLQGP